MSFKNKILIPIIFWGDDFLNLFESIFYPNLKKELELLINYKIEFQIWTTKINKRKIKKILFKSKKLTNKIIVIDELLNYNINNLFNDKYEILKQIQRKIFIKANNYKKIIFLYPDFIWKQKSIYNLIKINKKIVNIYCPQINLENYIAEKKPIENLEAYVAKNLHVIVKNTIINTRKSFFTAASNLFKIKNDAFIFKNFHLHPVMLNKPNFTNVSFSISLDEDLYSNYIIANNISNKDIYYQKNCKKFLFASLEKRDNLNNVAGRNKNIKNISNWVLNYCGNVHINNSRNYFFLNHKFSRTLKKKTDVYFNKIYKYIASKKINVLFKLNKENILALLLRRLYFIR